MKTHNKYTMMDGDGGDGSIEMEMLATGSYGGLALQSKEWCVRWMGGSERLGDVEVIYVKVRGHHLFTSK